jgi:glyoxylase-like metal-dependent hydrolase (beta-lactamase superfamily II)
MPLKRVLLTLAIITLLLRIGAAQVAGPAWTANIDDIRKVARLTPGRRPVRINVLKFAESRRTKNFSVKGAPTEPSIQARTVFQVVYTDGYIMIDSGMDEQVHKFFGRGVVEPYFPEEAKKVEQALRGARAIVLTHEHGDHAAGVIHTVLAGELASKTLLTRTQVQSLETQPQMPEIKMTPEMAGRYIVFDYEKYFPFAPGFALIKAPGHTPGSQMVYVELESGAQYLLIADTAWHMDGVREIKGKDAPWLTEDENAVLAQLKWLNALQSSEKNLLIISSHDEEQRTQLIQRGVLGDGLQIPAQRP